MHRVHFCFELHKLTKLCQDVPVSFSCALNLTQMFQNNPTLALVVIGNEEKHSRRLHLNGFLIRKGSLVITVIMLKELLDTVAPLEMLKMFPFASVLERLKCRGSYYGKVVFTVGRDDHCHPLYFIILFMTSGLE